MQRNHTQLNSMRCSSLNTVFIDDECHNLKIQSQSRFLTASIEFYFSELRIKMLLMIIQHIHIPFAYFVTEYKI